MKSLKANLSLDLFTFSIKATTEFFFSFVYFTGAFLSLQERRFSQLSIIFTALAFRWRPSMGKWLMTNQSTRFKFFYIIIWFMFQYIFSDRIWSRCSLPLHGFFFCMMSCRHRNVVLNSSRQFLFLGYILVLCIQLFHKTLSEGKQKVFKPIPQGNKGCFKSVFCWQKITPATARLVADFYSSFILNPTYHFSLKKHKVKLRFSRSALLFIPNFVQLRNSTSRKEKCH